MKKFVAVLIVVGVVVGLGLWWRASRRESGVGSVSDAARQDPVSTVKAFMDVCVKMNSLVQRGADRKEGEEAPTKRRKVTEEELKKLGIKDPKSLFQDARYSRLALLVMGMHKFDSYSVTGQNVTGERAEVTIEFTPQDVLGIKKAVAARGGPTDKLEMKPVSVPFRLAKAREGWVITEIRGSLGRAVGLMEKVGKR